MIVEAFLTTEPAGGRHAERVTMINALDDHSLSLEALRAMGPAAQPETRRGAGAVPDMVPPRGRDRA